MDHGKVNSKIITQTCVKNKQKYQTKKPQAYKGYRLTKKN